MSNSIPNDIQRLILDKVSSPRDHARSSAVCRLWNSIYKERTFHWVVFADHNTISQTHGFFSLQDQNIYRLNVPQLEGKYICGSSHGWLITWDDVRVLSLYDPFSKVHFQLSPLPHSGRQLVYGGGKVLKAILSCDPRKNPEDCFVFCIHEIDGMFYCKFEDKKWIKFSSLPYHSIDRDVIFYRGNFVVVYGSQLFICHLGSEPKVTPFGPQMTRKPEFPYLVHVEGNLALVNKYFGPQMALVLEEHHQDDNEVLSDFSYHEDGGSDDNDDDDVEPIRFDDDYEPIRFDDDYEPIPDDQPIPEAHFDVYKLDEDKGWRRENDIGDQVLFLGINEAKLLPASSVPDSIENFIYYGDRYGEPFSGCYYKDKGIFDLHDWKTMLLYSYGMTLPLPIWLFQN